MKYFCWIFIISIISCNEKKEITNPISYQIYCWSFFSCDSITPYTLTNTMVNVDISQTVDKKNLLIDESNARKSQKLYDLIINDKSFLKENSRKLGLDTRFALVLNYNNRSSDTLIYYKDSVLCLNDRYLIHYDFKILDSIKKKMEINCFECRFP